MRGVRLTGWGAALPDKVLTNADLESMLDTSDEWIVSRSGIRERHIGGTTSGLAVGAGQAAMRRAGCAPDDIGVLVLSTSTPDQALPATSSVVQHRLGLSCGAFDLNAACAGFVYGLVTAAGLMALGTERALVIGSDTMSRIIDWDDRSTAVLFADGAGAVVLEGCAEGESDLVGWDLGSDGSLAGLLCADIGGYLQMNGKEVFRRAVLVMVESATRACRQAGVSPADVALLVPHQANTRIIAAANQRLGISMERTAVILDRTGNTSSASIPMALAEAADQGRVHAGDLVLLVGFGAGMTSASAVLRWHGPGDPR